MSESPHLEVVILAAGQGRRMVSAVPKVLHPVAGRPMLLHVLDTVNALAPTAIHVVVGHQADVVRDQVTAAWSSQSATRLEWVLQAAQRGTGHAVQQALPGIRNGAIVLVVYGDVPLVRASTLSACVAAATAGALGVVTATPEDPAELGRIIRDPLGRVRAIVEYRDADPAQREIGEINSGIMALDVERLRTHLSAVQPDNAQGEYYLTDIVALAVASGESVAGLLASDPREVLGVNDRQQLASIERIYQAHAVERLQQQGVTVADPARLDIRGSVTAGADCFLDVNVVLEGTVRLGRGVCIGAGAVIRNAELADDVCVEPYTLIDGAYVGQGAAVGPFARIRPGTRLDAEVRIGNFVEIKKTVLGRGSKANHLAYLGDATIGADCNIGAGTVTCNYDGHNKHPTEIGDRVFVGTNSTLVAPLTIGADAFVAAGSTVTAPVAQGDLAVGRSRQRNISGWVRPALREKAKESPQD
jgi:bifunctional UDP-N-acetylglucosamine pyrophosphorylase/glucosamine-1-phosphate N-acetyltransferase